MSTVQPASPPGAGLPEMPDHDGAFPVLSDSQMERFRRLGRTRISAKALFTFIGALPHTEWLQGQLAADENGFLLAGRDIEADDLVELGGEPPLHQRLAAL